MKKEITQILVRRLLSYDKDSGKFFWLIKNKRRAVNSEAGYKSPDGYWYITVNCFRIARSRLAFLWMTGEWPKDQIDHKDCNSYNDKCENLREATNVQNHVNIRIQSNNSSGYKGVVFNKKCNKWQAQIRFNGGRDYLGLFATAKLAHEAYVSAAKNRFGEFARHK